MKHDNVIEMMMMIVNNPVKVKLIAEFPSSPVVYKTKSQLNRIILMIINNQHNAAIVLFFCRLKAQQMVLINHPKTQTEVKRKAKIAVPPRL